MLLRVLLLSVLLPLLLLRQATASAVMVLRPAVWRGCQRTAPGPIGLCFTLWHATPAVWRGCQRSAP
eukprot:7028727-Alexandrium_andersonii.AAC.1